MKAKFSFFVHFRKSVRDDMRLFWKPLGLLPESFYEKLCTRFGHRSYTWSKVKVANAAHEGTIELVPQSATKMLNSSREDFIAQMNQYLDKLVAKGIKVAGLGALTAPMTNGGLALSNRTDICLTNGNAFTAVIMAEGVKKIIQDAGLNNPKVAIVGATGSVGSCVTQILASDKSVQNFLLISQTLPKLKRLADTIQTEDTIIEVSTDLKTLTSADVLVILTASNATLITPEHLKKHAIILDGTQPRNTSKSILTERPDVTLIDGGNVTIKDIALIGGGFGLPQGEYFACFSETLLLALEGRKEHFCLGNATLEQANYIKNLAVKYKEMGFTLAPFSSFGKPVTIKKQAKVFAINPKRITLIPQKSNVAWN